MTAPTDGPCPPRNRPGLPALSYRVGTYHQFLDAMLARLPEAGLDPLDRPPGADDDTPAGPPPTGRGALAGLTTREPDDPSVALLDAWAVVADVLSFYQERIANEGFLGTATEHDSLVRLGRLVGHRPRPALAATTHLAYTLDPGTSCVVPAGSQVRSAPEPGGLPLAFETAANLTARAEWNRLPVRTTCPAALAPDAAITVDAIDVDGVQHPVRPGDRLLFSYPDPRLDLTRLVEAVERDPARGRTTVRLRVPDPHRQLAVAVDALWEDLEDAAGRARSRGPFEELLELLRDVREHAGRLRDPDTFAARLDRRLRRLRDRLSDDADAPDTGDPDTGDPDTGDPETDVVDVGRADTGRSDTDGPDTGGLDVDALAERAAVRLATVRDAVRRLTRAPAPRPGTTDREALLRDLGTPGRGILHTVAPLLDALRPAGPPPATRPAGPPTVTDALGAGSDALPRLLAGHRPGLTASFYAALAAVSPAAPPPPDVLHFRVTTTPLGAAVPDDARVKRLLRAAVPARADGTAPLTADVLLLDAVQEEIQPGSWIAVRVAGRPRTRVLRVTEAERLSVADEQDAARVTRLRLSAPWTDDVEDIAARRATTVWAAPAPLTLAPSPETSDVAGATIALDGTYEGLTPGRPVVVAGERTDVVPETGAAPGRRPGVPGAELAVLAGVRHAFDGTSPDARVRTTLVLTAPLAHRYRRDSVVVHGNVVAATAGETVTEVLGSGDATRAGLTLPLRQGPLVWLPAETADGGEEALTVRVDGVAWRRTADLGEAGPADQVYRLAAGADGKAAVQFGDGRHGARPPTGTENITARYRIGGGRAGNVPAGRISQVISKPLGVAAVTNPLPATGGADADGPAELRQAIPLRLAAFDRLVSVRDYESFARAFAGVGKAIARRCTDGRRPLVHVTVAAADDAPLDPAAPLLTGLRKALRRYGDPGLPVRVEPCERVRLVVVLGVRTHPDHLPDKVERRVREALAARLGFDAARLTRPVHLSAVVAAAHAVPGVDFVDVDAFGGVPEGAGAAEVARFADHPSVVSVVPALPAGPRTVREVATSEGPLVPVDTARAPTVVLGRPDARRPSARRSTGDAPRTLLRPAQLVLLDPAVPGTLILRRIP
ncbi:putative baseplate assembly protein [Streptomyces sp. NPDC001595]|uniref:putative baseplate assembly protein n=1 Tax=Streptomyces sp. NPDC001532 TaxID=3154520 RepID=UPI0033200868